MQELVCLECNEPELFDLKTNAMYCYDSYGEYITIKRDMVGMTISGGTAGEGEPSHVKELKQWIQYQEEEDEN